MEEKQFDIIILGGGPAGLSAAVYAARSATKVAIIDISMFGGQPSNYLELENYTGFKKVGGYELMEQFEEHADMFGVEKYPMEEIQSVDLTSEIKTVTTLNGIFKAKAIIIAQEMPREVLNKYGIIRLADEKAMTLDNIVEKPAIEDAPSNLTSYGRYLLTPEVFDHLDPKNTGLDNELWTVDAITKMAETGNVYVEKTRGQWMTTGDPKNYFMALLKFTMDTEDYNDEIKNFVNNH